MEVITLNEEDENVRIISSYNPNDDEIAIVFDSSKTTGGACLTMVFITSI